MKTNMKQEIRRTDGSVICSYDCDTISSAVEQAIKEGIDLSGADLEGANLCNAYLHGINLVGADLRNTNFA